MKRRDSNGVTWACAPGCDYPVTSYHARRGGRTLCEPLDEGKDEMNVLDEYDLGEPSRNHRRLTVPWKADGRNVMTDDGPDEKALHIATFASPEVAKHVVELHARTLGQGQDPPTVGHEFPNRPPLAGLPDGTVNAKRPYLPDDLRLARRYGPGVQEVEVSIRNGVERLVQELVHRRVAEYMARERPTFEVTVNTPVEILAQVVAAAGYRVEKVDAE